jgi:preprotein translocase subunit SecD
LKTQGGLRFIIILLVLGILTYLTINGSPTLGIPGVNDIRLGIDIRGGVYAQFYPDVPIEEITQTQVDAARRIIEERLDNKGIFDKNTMETGRSRI